MIKEACVETMAQCLAAEKAGANRLELCAHLELDGLTPEFELIERVVSSVTIPVRVMVRPRAGDFCYSPAEIEDMLQTIETIKSLNVEGVVIGVLRKDGSLDTKAIQTLAQAAEKRKVVVHKAIDLTPNPLLSLEQLLDIPEVTSVLTSGGARTAEEGREILHQMVRLAGNRLEIVACGKITPLNLPILHQAIHAPSYHGKQIV